MTCLSNFSELQFEVNLLSSSIFYKECRRNRKILDFTDTKLIHCLREITLIDLRFCQGDFR